jgi:hypothetical protein
MKRKFLTTTLVLAGVAVITIPVMAAPYAGGGSRNMRNLANPRVLEAHAEALGMTPEELETELKSGKRMKDILEENGVDPKELRDAVHELLPGSVAPPPQGCGRQSGPKGIGMSSDVMAAKADLLGMTVEELNSALESGQRMHDLLASRNMTPENLHEAIQEKYPDLKLGHLRGKGMWQGERKNVK